MVLFNLHQAANTSLNARFVYANFTLAPDDPRSAHVLEVKGSFLNETYATFKTEGREGPLLALVAYGADRPRQARVKSIELRTGQTILDMQISKSDGLMRLG